MSIHLHDGEAALPRTRIEIMGTEGDLALVSAPDTDPWAAQLQIGRLDLYHAHRSDAAWRHIQPDPDGFDTLPIEAANVARLYHLLAEDLGTDTHTVPGFRAAHHLHWLLDTAVHTPATERATTATPKGVNAAEGATQNVAVRPELPPNATKKSPRHVIPLRASSNHAAVTGIGEV